MNMNISFKLILRVSISLFLPVILFVKLKTWPIGDQYHWYVYVLTIICVYDLVRWFWSVNSENANK